MKKPIVFLKGKNAKLKILLAAFMLVAVILLLLTDKDYVAVFGNGNAYRPAGIYGLLGSLV